MDGPAKVKDPSRTKVEMLKQEEEIPREPNFRKTYRPIDLSSGSKGKLKGQKIEKDKPQ